MEHPKIMKIVGLVTSWIVLVSVASAAQQMRRSPPTPTRPLASRSMVRPVARQPGAAQKKELPNAAYNKNAALAKHSTLNKSTLSKNTTLNKNTLSKNTIPNKNTLSKNSTLNKSLASNKNLASTKNTTLNRNNTVNKNITSNKNVAANKSSGFKQFNLPRKPNMNGALTKPMNPGGHISGSPNWMGPKYAAFKNYHAMWQSKFWWTHHYDTIVFVGGGWYAWEEGYWIPAWGYDAESVYYYDGPIYACSCPTVEAPPDPCQVIANVQSALQAAGYYQGDVDGVLNPDTQAALTAYQQAQGLEATGAVDQATLETLGLASS